MRLYKKIIFAGVLVLGFAGIANYKNIFNNQDKRQHPYFINHGVVGNAVPRSIIPCVDTVLGDFDNDGDIDFLAVIQDEIDYFEKIGNSKYKYNGIISKVIKKNHAPCV